MSLATRAAAMLARLPPALTSGISIQRGVEIVMPDGVTLLADRYRARGHGSQPVVLMRSPYGRTGIWSLGARLFAERGYQVIIQSCRGTGGSGGEFNAYRYEAHDGRATLAWMERQPWFPGKVAMFGPSYLGIVQWAIATDPPDTLCAMAAPISSARVRAFTYPGGTFSLESTLTWLALLARRWRGGRVRLRDQLAARRRLALGFSTLPLGDADMAVTGERVPFYQDWLARMDDDAFWEPVEYDRRLGSLTVPVTMVTGWYDMFLPAQLADYLELRAAGCEVRLTVGPWKHTDPGAAGETFATRSTGSARTFSTAVQAPRARGCASSSAALGAGSRSTSGRPRRAGCAGISTPAACCTRARPSPRRRIATATTRETRLRRSAAPCWPRPAGRATTALSSAAAMCSSTRRRRWSGTWRSSGPSQRTCMCDRPSSTPISSSASAMSSPQERR